MSKRKLVPFILAVAIIAFALWVKELEKVLANVKKHTLVKSESYLEQLAYEKDERNA